MRATRNASKSTPPPKKPGKGTPGKGTPKTTAAEKKEDIPKVEADPVVAPDVEPVKPTEVVAQADVKPEGSDALDVRKEEKPEDAAAKTSETGKEVEGSKPKPSTSTKKGGTPKKKADGDPEKEGTAVEEDPLEPKPEPAKEVLLEKEPEKAVEESKESAPEPLESSSVQAPTNNVEVSKVVEEEGTDSKVLQGGEDEKMQEGGEDHAEDQAGHAGADEELKNEEDEDGDGNEEEDDGAEEDDEEDDEGEDLVEQRPVTERQKRKRLEVFVGGLDKEATVEEVKKTFEVVGEVEEVRLMTHPQSGKNRGYAFVRFATVDQAIRAATELDRTKIRDRECAVVPSEDNDTLFVGNICKSWTSDQVLEKLKEYGVEGIDEMILPADPENDGHNRGHAFLEFVTHNDAIKAFKRLSKPDAIFGCDRSARIAWAEGSSEPDETVMAKVKSIFVNGMPAEWDDGKLKEHFGKFGDIERIVLAKNIPRSKRTDFAFVNFATRDAAVAALEALNDVEITDGDKKLKLKVELAKPAPRKKRMRGHRGSYPVGGRPSKQKKGKGPASGGSRGDQRRGEGGRDVSRGGRGGRGSSQKNMRGVKRKAGEERPLPEERSRDRHRHGSRTPRAGAAVPRGNRGTRGGSSSRRGRTGAHSDDDYLPMGARISPGFATARGFSGRPPREDVYPRPLREDVYPQRAERSHAYSGPGSKRSYSALDEEAAYYGSGERGYPRARVEYAETGLGGVSLYPDSLRPASLGHTSLGHVLPPVRGNHGYTSALPGADYNAYVPAGPADPRGASYPSTYYGGRAGSGYTLPSSSGPYY
eukprot:c24612_g1_i1 orf=585-3026(-)